LELIVQSYKIKPREIIALPRKRKKWRKRKERENVGKKRKGH
jgi:hypothetical protein